MNPQKLQFLKNGSQNYSTDTVIILTSKQRNPDRRFVPTRTRGAWICKKRGVSKFSKIKPQKLLVLYSHNPNERFLPTYTLDAQTCRKSRKFKFLV